MVRDYSGNRVDHVSAGGCNEMKNNSTYHTTDTTSTVTSVTIGTARDAYSIGAVKYISTLRNDATVR